MGNEGILLGTFVHSLIQSLLSAYFVKEEAIREMAIPEEDIPGETERRKPRAVFGGRKVQPAFRENE